MYNILKNVIGRKAFNFTDMLTKIDTLWSEDKLSDAEREELITLAQSNASVENSVDMVEKLVELEQRIKALEEGKVDNSNTAETIEDYTVGKWYYRGNKVTFGGEVYECIAPEGVVCVWSPIEYSTFWRIV